MHVSTQGPSQKCPQGSPKSPTLTNVRIPSRSAGVAQDPQHRLPPRECREGGTDPFPKSEPWAPTRLRATRAPDPALPADPSDRRLAGTPGANPPCASIADLARRLFLGRANFECPLIFWPSRAHTAHAPRLDRQEHAEVQWETLPRAVPAAADGSELVEINSAAGASAMRARA